VRLKALRRDFVSMHTIVAGMLLPIMLLVLADVIFNDVGTTEKIDPSIILCD
jgi:hypothetical protein